MPRPSSMPNPFITFHQEREEVLSKSNQTDNLFINSIMM